MSVTAPGGTLYLIFIQVASRALTFVGNQVLLRYLSPSLLGIAVQLELVSVTILYIARESLRVALQRLPSAAEGSPAEKTDGVLISNSSQAAVNIAYLAVSMGFVVGLASESWYLKAANPEVLRSPLFSRSFLVYAVATLIELLSEPAFIVIQQHGFFKARARAETSAAIARCCFAVGTAFLATRSQNRLSVLPFAVGHLAYAATLFTLYFQTAFTASKKMKFALIPTSIQPPSPSYALNLFSKPLLSLALTLYLQSIFKLFLTQGDTLILSFLASLSSQGTFALASNYGGLLARLIFQPVEESSRNTFGRLLSSSNTVATANDLSNTASTKSSDEPVSNRPSAGPSTTNNDTPLHAATNHLSSLLHLYTLLSLPLILLAPPLLPHLAPYLLSSSFRTASTTVLLQSYIFYIPLMALNGILDAFFVSAASPKQLRQQSGFMVACLIGYAAVVWGLLHGSSAESEGEGGEAQALVRASCVNMVARIAFGAWFVDAWVGDRLGREERQRFWQRSVPDWRVVMGAGLGYVVVRYMRLEGTDVLRDLGVLVAVGVGMLGLM